MPPDPPAAAPPQRWQFSVLDLLLITTVVAAYLAAFGTIYRYAESRGEAIVLRALDGGGIGYATAMLGQWLVARYRSGRKLATLYKPVRKRWRFGISLAFPAAVLGVYAVVHLLGQDISQSVNSFFVICLIVAAMASTVLLFGDRTIWLCEFGIRDGGTYFRPWSRIDDWTWDENDADRLTIGRQLKSWTVIVPSVERATVDALLKEKLGHTTTIE